MSNLSDIGTASQIPTVGELLKGQKIVPVVVIENQQQALGLTEALLAGGVNVIEITLRSAFALDAIAIIKQKYPEMLVLAGTVNSTEDMTRVSQAGADGVISPGITEQLAAAAAAINMPYLPGVASGSEVLLAMQYGLRECKLFPASVVGGIDALKAFSGPFEGMQFCPTGGVGEHNYRDYLALPNVMCVGGSWLAPAGLIRDEEWGEITQLCLAAKS